MKAIITLDDWNTENITLQTTEALEWLRFYFPQFKVNLLVSGGMSIPENKYPDNFAYLLHGWNHSHFEELTDKQLQDWPYDHIYRAPYWELSDTMYQRLLDNGYKVLVNVDDRREGIKYDWNIQFPPDLHKDFIFGQGHITHNVNYIADKMGNVLMLPKDTEFKFMRDWGK